VVIPSYIHCSLGLRILQNSSATRRFHRMEWNTRRRAIFDIDQYDGVGVDHKSHQVDRRAPAVLTADPSGPVRALVEGSAVLTVPRVVEVVIQPLRVSFRRLLRIPTVGLLVAPLYAAGERRAFIARIPN